MAGGIVLGSVAVSAVSAVSADVLPYISIAIKAIFFKLGMCNICKNNIAKMLLDFFTSLAKKVMFLVALVCKFVCLFVCLWTTLLKKLQTDWDEILWRGPG